jgi:hypothetical protein
MVFTSLMILVSGEHRELVLPAQPRVQVAQSLVQGVVVVVTHRVYQSLALLGERLDDPQIGDRRAGAGDREAHHLNRVPHGALVNLSRDLHELLAIGERHLVELLARDVEEARDHAGHLDGADREEEIARQDRVLEVRDHRVDAELLLPHRVRRVGEVGYRLVEQLLPHMVERDLQGMEVVERGHLGGPPLQGKLVHRGLDVLGLPFIGQLGLQHHVRRRHVAEQPVRVHQHVIVGDRVVGGGGGARHHRLRVLVRELGVQLGAPLVLALRRAERRNRVVVNQQRPGILGAVAPQHDVQELLARNVDVPVDRVREEGSEIPHLPGGDVEVHGHALRVRVPQHRVGRRDAAGEDFVILRPDVVAGGRDHASKRDRGEIRSELLDEVGAEDLSFALLDRGPRSVVVGRAGVVLALAVLLVGVGGHPAPDHLLARLRLLTERYALLPEQRRR